MDKFIVTGGKKLTGKVKVSGSKNVAIKLPLASLLTSEKITIKNVPLISSFYKTLDIVKIIGTTYKIKDHSVTLQTPKIKEYFIPLEMGALVRTAPMVAGPLLARTGQAVVPNPGGCRLGARPIDRHIEGLEIMGAKISYKEGLFYATAKNGLRGANYIFDKNTHTGTEALILAAVLARGKTILENAAEEPEIDDLIYLLNKMGGNIKRVKSRTVIIQGVKELKGANFTVQPDRNELVTFACAAIATQGDVFIEYNDKENIKAFLKELNNAKIPYEEKKDGFRFYYKGPFKATDVTTKPHPGFMTDWQAPWITLMTQANGESKMHETIYENRFAVITELNKMGAGITLFNPKIKNPKEFYNFNWDDNKPEYFHAAKITGPRQLHGAVLNISDLRAGATLIIASLISKGESVLYGIEHIDRGYEDFEGRLKSLGADIKRVKEL